ncbi:e3 ubiquitin-protein ligase ubr4 [Anaeramoeba flamelloides]|uniref:E3 ubiquitin-protein ligase ubr4 n=1 Tax=Anaeramoeba flamelloides TaxID=1746091 RepID=A0AAV8A1Y3_9EUKA|nr:e3 ubiquitin-protein ligase ubr4 [Anaeramoeba flamelloides]
MIIKIIGLTGDFSDTMEVDENMTISRFKVKIQNTYCVEARVINIQYGENLLENEDKTFKEYGISSNDTIVIVKKLFTKKHVEGCIYNKNQKNYIQTEWFQCKTCLPFNSSLGCCSECAKVCHKGHELERRYGQFYCDCGCYGHNFITCTNQTFDENSTYLLQPLFFCKDCFPSNQEATYGCCYQCSVQCHHGHNVKSIGSFEKLCKCENKLNKNKCLCKNALNEKSIRLENENENEKENEADNN